MLMSAAPRKQKGKRGGAQPRTLPQCLECLKDFPKGLTHKVLSAGPCFCQYQQHRTVCQPVGNSICIRIRGHIFDVADG
jgi:hypothetical protein